MRIAHNGGLGMSGSEWRDRLWRGMVLGQQLPLLAAVQARWREEPQRSRGQSEGSDSLTLSLLSITVPGVSPARVPPP